MKREKRGEMVKERDRETPTHTSRTRARCLVLPQQQRSCPTHSFPPASNAINPGDVTHTHHRFSLVRAWRSARRGSWCEAEARVRAHSILRCTDPPRTAPEKKTGLKDRRPEERIKAGDRREAEDRTEESQDRGPEKKTKGEDQDKAPEDRSPGHYRTSRCSLLLDFSSRTLSFHSHP
ncbi:hypothetical protein WMY93_005784 [Mugilogobius chulae]|uniref:Uncharacterized protein n=1 Tax=Mugilogobius chulae TaxID=88201 RepID=A0AAW0PRU6_9GOBI